MGSVTGTRAPPPGWNALVVQPSQPPVSIEELCVPLTVLSVRRDLAVRRPSRRGARVAFLFKNPPNSQTYGVGDATVL